MPAVSYRDIYDLFDQQKATNNYQSLPEFAQSLNDLTGTQDFNAGLQPSWVKNASIGLDKAIEGSGAPDALGSFFGDIGGAFGYRDAGESAGRALPRGFINFLPSLAVAPFTGGGSIAAGLLGAGATAASAALIGADTYTQTGSPAAGLLSAAALPAAGFASRIGGQLALKAIGAPLLEEAVKPLSQITAEGLLPSFTPELQAGLADVGSHVADTGVQKVASYLGGQAAALGTFEAANEASSVVQGDGLYNPVTPDKLFATLIGQLPFAALDIHRVAARTPSVDSMKRFLTTEVKNVDSQNVSKDAPIVEQTGSKVDALGLIKSMEEQLKARSAVEKDTTLTQEEKDLKIAQLLGEADKTAQKTQGTEEGGKAMGQWLGSVTSVAQEGKLGVEGSLTKVEPLTPEAKLAATQAKVVESQQKAEAIVNVPPPTNLNDALSQVEDVAKAAVDSGVPPVTVEALKTNLENVQDVSSSPDDAAQKAVQVEKNKVGRGRNTEAATKARDANAEIVYSERKAWLYDREALAKTSSPKASEIATEIRSIHEFLRENKEEMGNNRKGGLVRPIVHAYYNWVHDGSIGGVEKLQSIMKNAKFKAEREVPTSRPVLKVDGTISADASIDNHKFSTIEEAIDHHTKLFGQEDFSVQPARRSSGKGKKKKSWYVLENTKYAPKEVSIYTKESGEQKSVVSDVIKGSGTEDYFAQQNNLEGPSDVLGYDTAAPLITLLNQEESSPLKTQGGTDLISTVNALDDEVIHANFMHQMEGDVEEHTRDIQNVRNRISAILQLQLKHGNKAVLSDKFLDELNASMPKSSKFETHKDVLEFNHDSGTQATLLEAAREMIKSGGALPAPEGSRTAKQRQDATRGEGSFVGFGPLEDLQKVVADTYKLSGKDASEPLAQVASLDQGLYGELARGLLTSFGDRLKKVGLVNLRVENGQVYDAAEYNPPTSKILYGTRLLPSKGLSSAQEIQYLHSVILHESLHALTHDLLRDSANAAERANLDSLRQQAIQLLPTDVRKVFDKSQAENRYEQYVKDRSVRLYDLTPEQVKWHGVLYGLETTDEFISQSFGSNQMQRFLRNEEGTRKGNVFKTFANFVKRLLVLGDVNQTLFEDVISATDRLLNPQLRKPFERENVLSGFMGTLGLMPKQVTERTQSVGQVVDLLGHMLPEKKNQDAYRGILAGTIAENFTTAHAKGQLSTEDTATLNRAQDYFDNIPDAERENVTGIFEHQGEPIQTVSDLLHTTIQKLSGAKTRKEFLSDLETLGTPTPIREAVAALRRYTTSITAGTDRLVDAAQRGLVNEIVDSPGLKHLDELYKGTQELLKTEKVLKQQEATVAKLQTITPIGFRAAQVEANSSQTPQPASPNENIQTIAEELGVVKPSLLSRTFEPLAQLAEKYPVMRDALYKVFKHQGDVRESTRMALLPFAGEIDAQGNVTLSKVRLQQAYEVAQSPTMNKTVSDIRRLMNEKKLNFDPTQAEFRDHLDKLSEGPRKQVIDFVNQMTKSMKVMQDTIVARQSELGTLTIAQLIQTRMPELKATQSQTLAHTLTETLRALDDPNQVATAQANLQGIQARMSPEVFQEVAQFAVGDKQRLNSLQGFFDGRPWFSTEQRFKRFLLRMTDKDGGTYTADYANERQAAQAKRSLESQGYKYADLIDRKGNDNHPSFSSDSMIDKVEEINKTRLAQISAVLRDQPEVLASISRYLNIDQDLSRAKVASQLISKGTNTRQEPGREELDMIANHVSYINRVINGQTSKVTRAGLELALQDPAMKAQPELAKLAQTGVENYLRPDTEAGRALTRANFLYYMGMNVSTGFMELGQSAFSLIPTMVREGQPVAKAYSSILESAKNIIQRQLTGSYSNPEHELVEARSSVRGEIGLGALGEAMDDNAHASIGLSQMATLQDMSSARKLVNKPLALYEKVATAFYSKFTQFNARMALLTAFDHFRSQGQTFDEAFGNAERINNVANFAGGRATRAIGLYGENVPRTAAMAVGSLQSYTLGMISMMGRYFSQGFGSLGRDLRPADRANAKKAALIMFGTQLAAAGALGLPGVGAGIALLEQMFPNLELNKAIRENLAKLGGDDHVLGSFISDTALRGIPNQIGGVDVGSRLSLGNNVMGLSSYDGFDPVNVLGPSVNLFKSMATGVSQLAQGQVSQAAQSILPPAYRKLIQLQQGDGAIRDQSGKLLLQPSFGEKFAMYVGFQPKALSDVKDAKRIESRSQEIERRETIQFNSKLADLLQANDQAGLRGALQSKLSEDNTFDPRAAIRQAASLVEQRTLPLDLSRTATSSTAGSLLQTYQGGSPSSPSELQRLQLRKSIEATTGIPGIGRVTPHDIQVAQQVDRLMATGLTRDQAKAQVDKMFSPKPVLPF